MGLISVVTGESRFLTSVSFRKDGGSEKLSQHSSSSMLVSGVPRLELETLGLGVITLAGTEEDLALEGEEIGVRLGELLADLALFGGKGGKRRGGRRRGGRRRGESSLQSFACSPLSLLLLLEGRRRLLLPRGILALGRLVDTQHWSGRTTSLVHLEVGGAGVSTLGSWQEGVDLPNGWSPGLAAASIRSSPVGHDSAGGRVQFLMYRLEPEALCLCSF